jgi:hypothetical protein
MYVGFYVHSLDESDFGYAITLIASHITKHEQAKKVSSLFQIHAGKSNKFCHHKAEQQEIKYILLCAGDKRIDHRAMISKFYICLSRVYKFCLLLNC